MTDTPPPEARPPDDHLSLMQHTRVVSVLAQPLVVGGTDWQVRVDYDGWISPWEAYALLKAGCERMESNLYTQAEDPQ